MIRMRYIFVCETVRSGESDFVGYLNVVVLNESIFDTCEAKRVMLMVAVPSFRKANFEVDFLATVSARKNLLIATTGKPRPSVDPKEELAHVFPYKEELAHRDYWEVGRGTNRSKKE
eukprot:GHVR01109460.1.p1 GENE.GHVR01109460.1~~GHVR01109460.1.p1  ORF type:complete len:117 (-),score=10.76 GHVR01109460.1:73-423(-)